MAFSTLVSVSDLAEHVEDPSWVILDARFTLDDEQWGRAAYSDGHIPGAQYADLATDLAGPIVAGVTGRRPFPDPDEFATRLSEWGVGPGTQVVAYDAANGLMAASRLWLMLRWMGHDEVAVLDGGVNSWLAAGHPLGVETPRPAPARFVSRLRPELLASVEQVETARGAVSTCVFDSRGADGYHGRGHYHDLVRGHIPGAGLADRSDTTSSDGHWRSAPELHKHYRAVLGEVDPRDVIFYCGSGVTAAQNVLGMAIAGMDGSRMYVGSWSEWITDPHRPVEL